MPNTVYPRVTRRPRRLAEAAERRPDPISDVDLPAERVPYDPAGVSVQFGAAKIK